MSTFVALLGMDPLARRELWNLLATLRKGRTMLLTTHYMDEADVLGDRIGIMAAGQMICGGSAQYLKLKYGPGYRLVVDFLSQAHKLQCTSQVAKLIQQYVPSTTVAQEESLEDTVVYLLPYAESPTFAGLFKQLDNRLQALGIRSYGLSGSSLEDVFVKVGAHGESDHDPKEFNTDIIVNSLHNNNKNTFRHNLLSQTLGIAYRKLSYAANDFTTLPLLLLPSVAAVGAAAVYRLELISRFSVVNAVVADALYTVGYLGIPGLLAEFIVRERNDKLRNVLNVMGCEVRAYWFGNLIADFTLLLVPSAVIWISWFVADTPAYYSSVNGLNFFVCLLFNVQIVSFSYLCSNLFLNPKSCVSFMPSFLILLAIAPSFCFSVFNFLQEAFNKEAGAPSDVVGSVIYWATVVLSPQGGLYACFLDISEDTSEIGVASFPPYGASIAIMFLQIVGFLQLTIYIDEASIAVLQPVQAVDRVLDEDALDSDVLSERRRVQTLSHQAGVSSQNPTLAHNMYIHGDDRAGNQSSKQLPVDEEVGGLHSEENKEALHLKYPLRIERLRRVYPPVRSSNEAVVAVEDVSFALKKGEIFGLLGANGAGKTTLLSMLTRLSAPTSGNAFVNGHSILTDFRRVARHLGVVTQQNALWDKLSVENHLFLFARLRGVPESAVKEVVEEVLQQLELSAHRHKLSMSLSGGMKRKLCVGIALIGDPEVVLLDEPSAGLDPLSRRQLWRVLQQTMAQRAVILTTHSMEEAEALCGRMGVMVRGQLRALGSKQHLKSKFSAGYEVTFKLKAQLEHQQSAIDALTLHLRTHVAQQVDIVYENGGLVTFRILSKTSTEDEDAEGIEMHKLFAAFEDNQGGVKERLGIESYTIAQASLEQVFIRIVTDTERAKPTETENKDGDAVRSSEGGNQQKKRYSYDLRTSRAKCGCSDSCLLSGLWLFLGLFVALLITGICVGTAGEDAIGGAVAITVGVVCVLIACILCLLRCCLACRTPIEEV